MLVAYVPLYFQIENTLFSYNPIFKTKAVLLILALGNSFQEPVFVRNLLTEQGAFRQSNSTPRNLR